MSTGELASKNISFLKQVMEQGKLEDIYEARDLTEVVFRTMRDLMPNEVVDRVESELQQESLEALPAQSRNIQKDIDITRLWKDTNPLVSWLSRLRSPLEFDAQLFIRRVEQEGGMPRGTDGETVIRAIFAATKQELSSDRIQEVGQFLPGKIQQLWLSI